MASKVLKHLTRTNKDNIEINNTEDQKLDLKDYKNLWCPNYPQNDNDGPETTSPPSTETDEISKSMKNRKAAGLPYLLTPGSRVLLEKLTALQLVKKFPAFY
jgi:hypothetical protein